MQKITPFLWFNDQAEEAARFYTTAFQNSGIDEIVHYGEGLPMPAGTVLTVAFRLAGQAFVALNGGPEFAFTPAISFFVNCQTEAETRALWERLSEGGMALMELTAYPPFSPLFGWVADRFGLTWQVNLSGGSKQSISPHLLFVGEEYGEAEAAINHYTAIFPDSAAVKIDRYGPGENEMVGAVRLARFRLAGQEFMAMDSGHEHNFTFTPATSFYVHCKDQAEVDDYWERLTAGGEESPCGWLVDKFGVSWQIVPDALPRLMADPDPARANRVTQAMLGMKKLDVAALQRAADAA